MRRDWEYVMALLEVTEKLAGHPNLKGLRDDALKDLEECAAEPPQTWVPEAPEPEPEGVFVDDVGPSDDGVPVVTGRRRI